MSGLAFGIATILHNAELAIQTLTLLPGLIIQKHARFLGDYVTEAGKEIYPGFLALKIVPALSKCDRKLIHVASVALLAD